MRERGKACSSPVHGFAPGAVGRKRVLRLRAGAEGVNSPKRTEPGTGISTYFRCILEFGDWIY